MTFRKINLGTLSLLAGLLVAPATATAALCAPKPGGAALNLRESDFTIPTALRGTKWRIQFTSASGGASVNLTVKGRTIAGFPSVTTEVITLPPNASRTTSHEFCALTSVVGDRDAAANISIEWELIGVTASADNAPVLEGVCTNNAPVPRYSWATVQNDGSALVQMDLTETLSVGGLVVSAANGKGRMKQIADAGATIGRCQSGSFIARGGSTFINCAVDPR